MSLINEALKKAQRQRAENPAAHPSSPSDSAGTPTARVVKRRPPMPARTQTLILGGCLSLVLMGGSLAFVLLTSEPSTPPPTVVAVRPPAPPTPPVTQPEPPAPPPVEIAVKLPPIAVPEPVMVAPVTPVAPVEPVKPVTPPTPPAPLVPTANPKVYEILEALRITGIRASETDPKVIMNERVYRLNDIVDRGTQLRLIRVDTTALVFADASGFEYRKSF